jgi:hypothetical protein
MCWQLFDTMGILIGSTANYVIYCYSQSKPNWRFMISISGVPALLFLILTFFCVGTFLALCLGIVRSNTLQRISAMACEEEQVQGGTYCPDNVAPTAKPHHSLRRTIYDISPARSRRKGLHKRNERGEGSP